MSIDLRRIRERKLVEWLLAYAAGAWLALEGLAMAREAFEWPASVMRLGLGVAALGVPVVAVLAWYHGEQGRQRVSGAELLILGALLGMGGLFLGGVGRSGRAPVPVPDEIPSVAVLPFVVLGGTVEDVAFAEGMHDELLHRLARIGGIRVTSRTSVVGIREQLGLSRDIAEALRVRHLVEATSQRYGDEVRIIVQLIDPFSDDHVWSDTYTARLEPENLFGLQAEISTAIAGQLAASLSPAERERVEELPTRSLEAYLAFQRGNAAFWRRFFTDARAEATEAYREAIELDPRFVDAHAQLARVLALSFWFADPEAAGEAWSSGRSAQTLDSASASTHRALGDLLYYTLRDYTGAREHYERVMELEPSDAETLAQLGLVTNRQGRTAEAVGHLERSLRLDPRSVLYADQLGYASRELYDGPAARRWSERALALDPASDTYRHRIVDAELCVNGDTVAARTFVEATEWTSEGERRRALGLLAYYRGDGALAEDLWRDVRLGARERALFRHAVGDAQGAAAIADSVIPRLPDTLATARAVAARYRQQQPGEPWSTRGLFEAVRGNHEEGIRWARRGLDALSADDDAIEHAWRRRDLIRVLAITGEAEQGVTELEALMAEPSDVGPGCYRLEPLYAPLRAHPRFEAVLALSARRRVGGA